MSYQLQKRYNVKWVGDNVKEEALKSLKRILKLGTRRFYIELVLYRLKNGYYENCDYEAFERTFSQLYQLKKLDTARLYRDYDIVIEYLELLSIAAKLIESDKDEF